MRSLFCYLVLCLWTTALAEVCPDGSSCSEESTCCQLEGGGYGCCPLPNAVCCDDLEHCCPSGYTCSEGLCFLTHQSLHINSSLVCPGGEFSCPDGNTCCPAGAQYTCCPLPDATCCTDGEHCCPRGTTCDVAHQTCNVPILKIAGAAVRRTQVKVVDCPGGEYQCPDQTTCCLLASGVYGCCPLPNAVCCDDKVHCCPNGYTCDASRCVQAGLPSTPQPSVPITLLQSEGSLANSVDCPDGSSCPDGNTCCQLSTGKYACCPLQNAVCCSDHIHCCPKGTQCDVSLGRCNRVEGGSPLVVPWVKKIPARPRQPELVTPKP